MLFALWRRELPVHIIVLNEDAAITVILEAPNWMSPQRRQQVRHVASLLAAPSVLAAPSERADSILGRPEESITFIPGLSSGLTLWAFYFDKSEQTCSGILFDQAVFDHIIQNCP